MSVPRDGMESDKFRVKRSLKFVRHMTVAVAVSWENLQSSTKEEAGGLIIPVVNKFV